MSTIEARLARLEQQQTTSDPGPVDWRWAMQAQLAAPGIVQPPTLPRPRQPEQTPGAQEHMAWRESLPDGERLVLDAWTLAAGLRGMPDACLLPDSEGRLLAFLRERLRCPDLELDLLQTEALAIARTDPTAPAWARGQARS